MIDYIFIKNFKVFERETIRLDNHNIIIGENDSGKSSILEALDIFFNYDKIPNIALIPNKENDVEIGIYLNSKMYKKIYTGKTKKETYDTEVFNDFPEIKYIFLDAFTKNVSKLINDLTVAKALDMIDESIKTSIEEKMIESANQVLATIDPSMIVINGEETNFSVEPNLKIDSALKFKVSSEGIPIEGRGSGFQKNVLYSLITKGNYQNVILGIDEIENSLSVRNSSELINLITERFMQTIITTHSAKILEVSKMHNIIPRYTSDFHTLSQLLYSLDNTNELIYIIVEGKFDVPWIKCVLNNIDFGFSLEYIILPGGGTNMNSLADSLEFSGKKVVKIKDGDAHDDIASISKEIIEMYTPLNILNETFDVLLETYPLTKDDFFNLLTNDVRNEISIKSQLSRICDEFINKKSDLVSEIKSLIISQLNLE